MGRHAFAEHKELAQAERLADFGTRLPAYDDRLELCQVAFEELWELVEKLLTNDRPENRISQELHPFVGRQTVIGAGRVNQRGFEQRGILELVPDSALADREPGLIQMIDIQRGRLRHGDSQGYRKADESMRDGRAGKRQDESRGE